MGVTTQRNNGNMEERRGQLERIKTRELAAQRAMERQRQTPVAAHPGVRIVEARREGGELIHPTTRTVTRSGQGEDLMDAGRSLKESNHRLVSYIDKARVLNGVKELRESLPDTLVETSFFHLDCKKTLRAECQKLKA